jgi:hypothetical protein
MKDLKVENYLKRGQFKYTYQQFVSFADIDIKASKENPARMTRAIDDLRVTKYACEMIDGVEFPAIVLLNLSGGSQYKWIIATGVHRTCGAIEALLKGFEGYCVTEPDQYRREVLFKQLNTLEGVGVPIAEQYQIVIDLHLKNPSVSLRQLAKEWDLKLNAVQNALNDHRARQRGLRLNWDFKQMRTPQKTYMTLNRITSDVTYNAATECAINNKLAPSAVEDMVSEVLKTKSESDAAIKIQDIRDAAARAEAKNNARIGKLPQQHANKMLSDAKRFIKHLDKGMDNLYLASLTDFNKAMDILEQVIDRAKDIKAAIQHIQQVTQAAAE